MEQGEVFVKLHKVDFLYTQHCCKHCYHIAGNFYPTTRKAEGKDAQEMGQKKQDICPCSEKLCAVISAEEVVGAHYVQMGRAES